MPRPPFRSDVQSAALVSTYLTLLFTALEMPLVVAWIAFKWITGFIGATIGLIIFRIVCMFITAYKARKESH